MIVGICGAKGAGKSTIAQHLCQKHGFVLMSFASLLKDIVAIMFSWDRALLEGDTDESRQWREEQDIYWSKVYGHYITPRMVLQDIGCMFRNYYDKDFWIKALIGSAFNNNNNNNIVIADLRFPNEAEFIKQHQGFVIKVYREKPGDHHESQDNNHESELAFKSIQEDANIWNHPGLSLEELNNAINFTMRAFQNQEKK